MEEDTYCMLFKDGCDGAGQQTILKSTKALGGKDHMFLYGIVPLRLVCKRGEENIELWVNKTPNSCKSLRPTYLIREVETDMDMLNLVIKDTDAAKQKLKNNGLISEFMA